MIFVGKFVDGIDTYPTYMDEKGTILDENGYKITDEDVLSETEWICDNLDECDFCRVTGFCKHLGFCSNDCEMCKDNRNCTRPEKEWVY